ncbi:phosphatidylethanolamine-binding protein 1-like, partial [Diaphorina citri]|uniref:Phosphatidylethanolamine-binding protein 1-like n=1 Tax=Diaphorina citri TaxID=121845 RepID=A0A1S3DRF6_DIACI
MTDPDAPSRKEHTYREWHHWLVGNIKGGKLDGADFLSAYVGAGPPPNTGLHRYVFLVYKQPNSITFDEARLPNNSQDGRAKFSIANFAEKYKLGEPIAVNFFQAEYDDYVPTLYKQLGFQVEYPGGVSVNLGNVLTPTQVKDQPTVTWNADPNQSYVLCMTDPDAPSRKEHTYREWHHWLVGNIKGGKLDGADFLSAYVGAGPPPNTGLHRYVFLVYKQPNSITFDEARLPNNSQDGRAKFSIANFAEKYKLGEPKKICK